jgi:hypothetical protein
VVPIAVALKVTATGLNVVVVVAVEVGTPEPLLVTEAPEIVEEDAPIICEPVYATAVLVKVVEFVVGTSIVYVNDKGEPLATVNGPIK